jgi:surfeit locus 1 family protein
VSAFRKLLWPGLATLIALGILLSLGFWQLGRMVEKRGQLDTLETSAVGPSEPLAPSRLLELKVRPASAGPTGPGELVELRRVSLAGRFLPGRSVPVRGTLPATKGAQVSGVGFFWMTPLETETGAIVFINRGFVPSGGDWRAPPVATPEGVQMITGLARMPEKPRAFVPADNPAKGEYFTRDPAAMARAVGINATAVADFFIDAERQPDNLTPPVGVDAREIIARIPNNHLQYAVTWFAFAATLIGVFGFFARARLKETA